MSTLNDESESNLSVGSDYENKSETHELEKVVANMTRPTENVLLFFAVCVHLLDLDAVDRGIAQKWLSKWDDKSRVYSKLKERGREIANI
jgi:hypothetical protein